MVFIISLYLSNLTKTVAFSVEIGATTVGGFHPGDTGAAIDTSGNTGAAGLILDSLGKGSGAVMSSSDKGGNGGSSSESGIGGSSSEYSADFFFQNAIIVLEIACFLYISHYMQVSMNKWLLAGIFMLCISSAYAVQISEVMYKSNEWIEIYNNDISAVNLSGWTVLDPVKHLLTLTSGSWEISPNTYAVIAEDAAAFNSTYGSYSGTLIDASALGLNDAGIDWIALNDTSGIIRLNVSYTANVQTSGNTLHLSGTGWCEGVPTPGAGSSCTQQQQNNNTNGNNDTGDDGINETKEFEVDLIEFPAKAAQGDNFSIMVRLKSNLPSRENVKVYSYVYKDQALATEGGWTANQKFYEIESGEEIEVELYNAIKSDANPDFYFLRVRTAVNSKNYDTTEQIEVVENPNPEITAEKIGEISSFYTRVKNLDSGREIKMYANVKNLAGIVQDFVLRLENQTKEISLSPEESQTVNFTVILPNANSTTYLLELLYNNTVIDSKELPVEITPGDGEESLDEEISEESYDAGDRSTGSFTWNNSKPNTPLLLLAIVMVIIIVGMALTLVNLKKRPEQIS